MISYLFSIFGLFTILLGMVTFILLPIVPKITGRAKFLARYYLWLMARVLKRGAFAVSAHGDVLLKRMSFDDRGVETMEFDDMQKAFEDPDEARHYFYGIPFALADEVHGLLFDPRHAAAGARKAAFERNDDMQYRATESEATQYDVQMWVRGIFEFPKDAYELVDLQAVRNLATGLERAEHPETVETFVENSYLPYKDGASASRLLILVAAIVGPFVALGIMVDQLGGGAGPDRVIGFGSFLALVLATGGFDIRNIDPGTAKRLAGSVLGVLAVLAIPAAIGVLFGPMTALGVVVSYLLGFVIASLLVLVIGKFTGKVARLLLQLGFMGYDRPVFVWTPQKYVLREYSNLGETTGDPIWYTVAGTDVGFTYEPGATSFASGAMDAEDIAARSELTDGKTNLPAKHSRYPDIARADYIKGFVPDDITGLPVHTGILFSAFTHAAIGIKSHRYLTQNLRMPRRTEL